MAYLLSLILLATSVSARTVFSALSVNGVDQGHAVGIRVPSSNAPITNISSTDLICNTNFIQPVSTTVIPVPAGAQVTAQFHHYSAGYLGPDPADPLDPTDKGPVLAYLYASVPEISSITNHRSFIGLPSLRQLNLALLVSPGSKSFRRATTLLLTNGAPIFYLSTRGTSPSLSQRASRLVTIY